MAGNEVEAYLQALPEAQREALERLRRVIRGVIPDATESITYGVPTFKQKKAVVAMGAGKNHCSLYVMSPEIVEAHRDELAGYETTKGGVHFTPDKPLPDELVVKLVRARVAENEAKEQAAAQRARERRKAAAKR